MGSALMVAVVTAVLGPILVGFLVRYLDQYTGPTALRRRILEDYAVLEKLPEDDDARPYLEGIIHENVWRYAHTHYVDRARGQIRPMLASVCTVVVSTGIVLGGSKVFREQAPQLDTTSLTALKESVRRLELWGDYMLAFLLVVSVLTMSVLALIWWRYVHNLWNPSLPLSLPKARKPADTEEAAAEDAETDEPPKDVSGE